MNLIGKKETKHATNGKTYNYTSGMVSSAGKFSGVYYYAEVRAKVPKGKGYWPAFWMVPEDHSWPPELDVVEILGHEPNAAHATYHWIDGVHQQKAQKYTGADFSADYHVFAADWTADAIIWYIDGREIARYTDKSKITNKPLLLILNLAIGGKWPGSPDSSTVFPQSLDVDYVRVWKRGTGTNTTSSPSVIPSDSTRISMKLALHGLGKGGDSANPNSTGTISPLRSQRTVSVDVYNDANVLIKSVTSTVIFNPASGLFEAIVDLGANITTGTYQIRVKTDQYLRTLVPGIQTLTKGQTKALPLVFLISGDINQDNVINILDYNTLMGCYSDLTPAVKCSASEVKVADITDDGKVNQLDYNLFLRELSNRGGQ